MRTRLRKLVQRVERLLLHDLIIAVGGGKGGECVDGARVQDRLLDPRQRAYHIPLSGTLPLSLFLSLPIAVSLAVCYVTLVEAADSARIIVCGLLVGVALLKRGSKVTE